MDRQPCEEPAGNVDVSAHPSKRARAEELEAMSHAAHIATAVSAVEAEQSARAGDAHIARGAKKKATRTDRMPAAHVKHRVGRFCGSQHWPN